MNHRVLPSCIARGISASIIVALSVVALRVDARPSDADEARAKQLFLAGKERYRLEMYVAALANFHEALKLVRRSSVLLMMGHAYRRLDLPDKALRYYKEYLRAWAEEKPKQRSPHQSTVEAHIVELGSTVEAVTRGETQMKTDAQTALSVFEAELARSRWPRIRIDIALCQEKLGEREAGLSSIREAIRYWEQHAAAWKLEASAESAPEYLEVQRRLARLRGIERRMAGTAPAPVAGTPVPSYTVSPPARAAQRSKVWLATGITAAVLTVGFEVMAWVSYVKGNELFTTDPDFDRYRTLTIAGHVLAGSMAVASGVSFLLYHLSGKPRPERRARVMVLPGPGQVCVGASLRF